MILSMTFASFPSPTTCEFCGATQNGICVRQACIVTRLEGEQQYAITVGIHQLCSLLGTPRPTEAKITEAAARAYIQHPYSGLSQQELEQIIEKEWNKLHHGNNSEEK